MDRESLKHESLTVLFQEHGAGLEKVLWIFAMATLSSGSPNCSKPVRKN
jgi:hypothetical protein